ncbi:hypothetical protein VNO80_30566 [Phaseolus coccineus]|uniref:Uncharacterized protein n=1 Tax=Phaseolus coccineus TaxID=3886 RepID=A0AAN9LGA5_PHACN
MFIIPRGRRARGGFACGLLGTIKLFPLSTCCGRETLGFGSLSKTMVQRLTYHKRHNYATKSNQHRVVKTPSGKLVYQSAKKRTSGPKC